MSTYDDSSLFLYPSGYKASVLFAQKPMDANGQLAFARSNDTATRVDENGLIEKVRTNLLTYSNDFSNAAWVKGSDTFIFAGFSDPFGGSNAWRITTGSGAGTFMSQAFTFAAVPYTFSIWAKANGNTNLTLQIANSAETSYVLTSDWQRISLTFTPTAGASTVVIGNGLSSVDALIYGSQLETGDIATDYIATTTTAVSVGPVANIPRIDYTGGGCGKLLLEPQRTNLVTFSEQFDNAAWTKFNSSVSANQVISPDGYLNADKLIPNTVAASHQINVSVTGAAHTLSIFAKAGEYSTLALFYTVHDGRAVFNLSNGTITETTGTVTSRIEDYGNGWYRCILSTTLTTHNAIRIYAINGTTWADVSTAGNGTSGILIYGAQLEAGSYASSYVPTLAASVTRGADACSKTGISSLIGQTEGTLFVEFENNANFNSNIDRIISISDGTSSNRLYLAKLSSGASYFVAVSGGTQTGEITGSAIPTGNVKIAVAYKTNDCIIYINGAAAGTDTSVTIPACSQLFLGRENGVTTDGLFKPYKQALLFKTRLSNADLAALTA
jgi:hypothetical protein